MEIKTHPPIKVLYSSHQTTLNGLGQFIGNVMKDLHREAVKQDLLVSGPCYWIYYGADGRPDTVFTLEIALPIQGRYAGNAFATKELSSFKAVSHMHEKDWTKLSDSYGSIIQFILKNNIGMTSECREIYWNIDFEHPENNLTEIQVGVMLPGLNMDYIPNKIPNDLMHV